MKSLATALCFIAFGTAAPMVPIVSWDQTPTAVLAAGKLSGSAAPTISYPSGKGDVLLTDFRFIINGEEVVIPRGFLFDGASVPRAFWSIIGAPNEPDFMLAALLHDWLYWSHQWTKAKADAALRDLLVASGVSAIRAGAMFRAVDLFGGTAWRKAPGVTEGSRWILEGDEIVPHPKLVQADKEAA
ncbi:MAG: hypothetical protein RL095_3700 [Verrucomicrobiota bacterium]|jgi:hypothetical protein